MQTQTIYIKSISLGKRHQRLDKSQKTDFCQKCSEIPCATIVGQNVLYVNIKFWKIKQAKTGNEHQLKVWSPWQWHPFYHKEPINGSVSKAESDCSSNNGDTMQEEVSCVLKYSDWKMCMWPSTIIDNLLLLSCLPLSHSVSLPHSILQFPMLKTYLTFMFDLYVLLHCPDWFYYRELGSIPSNGFHSRRSSLTVVLDALHRNTAQCC